VHEKIIRFNEREIVLWIKYARQLLLRRYQFLLFLLVGLLNTLFGYGVFCLFIWLGLHYIIATLLSTCCGIIFNFHTIGRIVFKNHDYRLIMRFIVLYAGLYFINIYLIKVAELFLNNIYMRGLFAIILVAVLSYILNKKFVFRAK
jgi:putative flippase GtrA